MLSHHLACFRPDPVDLLRRIAPNIDDSMLREIAEADYGQAVQEHFAKLLAIRDATAIDAPMGWEPMEVLNLIYLSQPDQSGWKPGGQDARGHWMRAFACAAWLCGATAKENTELREGWNTPVIQLLESLAVVGGSLYASAASLLASLLIVFESDSEVGDMAFLGVALLWLALRLRPAVSDTVIVRLIDWVKARELTQPRDIPGDFSGQWLLGTTYFNLHHAGWRRLGLSLLNFDLADRSFAAQKQIRWIGGQLR